MNRRPSPIENANSLVASHSDGPARSDAAASRGDDSHRISLPPVASGTSLHRAAVVVIIAFGVLVRFIQYASDRSLWLDEAMLSLNILHRTALQLLQPLEYQQGAPPAFLWLERLAAITLGPSEHSLRLFPFLASILSIFVFYIIGRRWLTRKSALVALFLFAICIPLIHWSSQAKQYSIDVLVALLLYAAVSALESRFNSVDAVLLGSAGAISVWFSHPAIFVFTGVCVTLFASFLVAKNRKSAMNVVVAFSLSLASFAALYWLTLARYVTDNSDLRAYFSHNFAPLPFSVSAIAWYYESFLGLFDGVAGLGAPALAALASLVGAISMYRSSRRRLCFLMLPVIIALAASGLHRYPFSDRFLLFAIPGLLLLVSEGLERMGSVLRSSVPAVGLVLLGLLSLGPLRQAIAISVHPYTIEELRPVLAYVEGREQPGDVIYVYYGAKPAFDYYWQTSRFRPSGPVVEGREGRSDWHIYESDLMQLRGDRRVWIVISHNWTSNGVDEEKLLSYDLDTIGHRMDTVREAGAVAYLYEMQHTSPPK